MIKYDTSEEYEIEEAMKNHAEEISRLLEKTEVD